MLRQEESNWDITINDVVKINTDEGDTLLVSLPEAASDLPRNQLADMYQSTADAFKETFKGKDINILVVQHGMKVEIIKSSVLVDKDSV